MTILHSRSDPQFADHLRSVLDDASVQPHSVDIAVGYFYLSGFAQAPDLPAAHPGAVRILIGRADRPTMAEIAAGYSPRKPPLLKPSPTRSQRGRPALGGVVILGMWW